jgi:hypothetical protein
MNGGASPNTSAIQVKGTPYTAGTTTTNKPLVFIETAGAASSAVWHSNGTMFGVNAPTGFTGHLANYLVDGATKFAVTKDGAQLATGSAANPALRFNGWADNTGFYSVATGQMVFGIAGTYAWSWTSFNFQSAITNSCSIRQAAGSATNPTYHFAANSGCGLYASGTNAIGLSTSSTARLVIDANGLVGIGTAVVNNFAVTTAYTASANNGYVSIGTGGFAAGTFGLIGNANGTYLAMNAPSGYTGDMVHFGKNSVSMFKIDEFGVVTTSNDLRTASTFTVNNTATLATVTGLSGNVRGGSDYRFRAVLNCTCNASGGVKVAIGGTATATSISYTTLVYNDTTLVLNDNATALGTAHGFTGASAGGDATIIIEGVIDVNAGGTLLIQFAQNAAHASNASVLINSTFEITGSK